MEERYTNIYQKARKAKGLTQERAAELLNLSVDSLKSYESGRTAVPNPVVNEMIVIYNADYLAVQHLRTSPVGETVIPAFETDSNLAEAALSLIKELNDVVAMRDKLIEICADGKVDVNELTVFESALKELRELNAAIYRLTYADKGIDNDR